MKDKINNPWVLGVLILLGSIGVSWLLVVTRPQPTVEAPNLAPPQVTVMKTKVITKEILLTSDGIVEPKTESLLSPEVSGRVIMVSENFGDGGEVEQDQILFKLDDADLKLVEAQAEHALAQAKLRLSKQEADTALARENWADRIDEATPLALKEPQLEEASAAVSAAEASLLKARLDVSRTVFRAPFKGALRKISVDVGSLVNRGQAVAELFSSSELEVKLPLREEEYRFIRGKAGAKVRLTNPSFGDDAYWIGSVLRIEERIDEHSRFFHLVVRLEGQSKGIKKNVALLPGMFLKAEVTGRAIKGKIWLPSIAMQSDSSVYIVDGENRIHSREVKLLTELAQVAIVDSGLSGDELVVVDALPLAEEGMEIKPYLPEGS